MSDQWRRCRGWRPRLTRWLCQHGPARLQAGARTFAVEQVEREVEEERLQALLSAVWSTGRPVLGTVDEDGAFEIRLFGLEPSAEDGHPTEEEPPDG